MSNLTSTIVNGDLTVTGDIYGSGQCFLVEASDSGAFNKMVAAYQQNKPIILRGEITMTGASLKVLVPLVRVDTNASSGNIIKFTFARAREYGDSLGIIDVWWSTSSSNGFVYDDPPTNVYKALYSGSAVHSGTASTVPSCSGNATQAYACTGNALGTAARAQNDGSGNNIVNTYMTLNERNSLTGWMFASNSDYNMYSGDGVLMSSGSLTSSDSHYFDRLMQTAAFMKRVYYLGSLSGEQMMVPGYYNWKTYSPVRLSVTNTGSSTLTVKIVAGGMWGTTRCSGTVLKDGMRTSDDANIASWTNGKRNQVALGTVQSHSFRVWEIFYYKDTKTFADPVGTVENQVVYVTTVH